MTGFLFLWLVALGLSLCLRRLGLRLQRSAGATSSTTVSRNAKTGPKWEQDVPITQAELDAEIGDDL